MVRESQHDTIWQGRRCRAAPQGVTACTASGWQGAPERPPPRLGRLYFFDRADRLPAMQWAPDRNALRGRVAVVAGATRGAGRGIAAALGEAGATVICTGRSTRDRRSSVRSDYTRP